MNYLIKGVLKKVFEQYLNIKEQLDLQSGIIKLSSGKLNHQKLNKKLQLSKLHITQSQYKGLNINIPVLEIMSKPIKLSIQLFEISIIQGQALSPTMNKNTSQSQTSSLKGIANRLLYNMQISIQKIYFKIFTYGSLFQIYLSDLNIRNSLIFVDSNIIKKTINLFNLQIKSNYGNINIQDFNLCLDYDPKTKLSIIALLGYLNCQINDKQLLNFIKTNKQIIEIKNQQQLKKSSKDKILMNIYFKINQFNLLFLFSKLIIKNIQLKYIRSSKIKNLVIDIKNIYLKSLDNDKIILSLSYLPQNQDLQVFFQYEDKILKNAQISIQQNHQQLVAKIYYIQLYINYNNTRQYIHYLTRNYFQDLRNLLLNRQSNLDKSNNNSKTKAQLLIYRAKLISQVNSNQLAIYLSGLLTYQIKQLEIKIFQFGMKFNEYKILKINGVYFIIDWNKSEIVAVLNYIKCQTSKYCIDQMKKIYENILKKDILAYSTILGDYFDKQNMDQIQNEQNITQDSLKPKFKKIYAKIPLIKLQLGAIDTNNNFLAVFQLEISNSTLYYNDKNLNFKTECSLNIYSPHTLQKNQIINELKIEFRKNYNQLTISLRNNCNITLQESYIQIFQLYFEDNANTPFLTVTNMTNETMKIKQNNTEIDIKLQSKSNIYVESATIWIIVKGQKSQQINLLKNQEEEEDIILDYRDQSKYVIKWISNGLIIKCKYMIGGYTGFIQNVIIYKLLEGNFKKTKFQTLMNIQMLNYKNIKNINNFEKAELLQDLIDDIGHTEIEIQNKQKYLIEILINNQKYKMYGLKDKNNKLYDYYLLESRYLLSVYFQMMPFLIVENNLQSKIYVKLKNRKTQDYYDYQLEAMTHLPLLNNGKFDYYMKQFTFTVKLESQQSYTSQQHYFNTFFMVNQQFESVVELRSNNKNNYGKQYLIVSESISNKTKILTFISSLTIINNSSFNLGLTHQQRSGNIKEIVIEPKTKIDTCIQFKNTDTLGVKFNNLIENKIILKSSILSQNVVLSFNFCKQDQKYYQILISAKFQVIKSVQYLIFQDFVRCQNLSKKTIQVNDRPLAENQSIPLLLPSTVDYRFNNRAVQVYPHAIEHLYNELFMADNNKISGQPLLFRFPQYNLQILFHEMLLNSARQSGGVGPERKIYTLLKDLKQRMQFYICEDIYNSGIHYYIFRNQSSKYFLLSQQGQYVHHFQGEPIKQHKQQKILIKPYSCNKLMGRQHYQMFLCDENQNHLQKIQKKQLIKQKIKKDISSFQSFTVLDVQKQSLSHQIQLLTKIITIKIKTVDQPLLIASFGGLTIRRLEKDKIDCLIRGISLTQENNNQYILHIPQQSYFLLEGKALDQKFYLIKNLFVKCKHVIVNIHEKLPYALLAFYKSLGLQENTPKQDPDSKLKRYLSQPMLLIRNVYIHQIHLSLTLKMDSIDFSNTLNLPHYQLNSKNMKLTALTNQIQKFYLTNLLAKFPKLSFFLQNIKNSFNFIRILFNIRGILKNKNINPRIISLQNQKKFSLQNYNIERLQKIIEYIEYKKKYYLLSKQNLIILQNNYQEQLKLSLRDLQKVKLIRNKPISQIYLKFKKQNNLSIFVTLKKAQHFVNLLNGLLL